MISNLVTWLTGAAISMILLVIITACAYVVVAIARGICKLRPTDPMHPYIIHPTEKEKREEIIHEGK